MLALDNAADALTKARDAYAKGDNAQVTSARQGNQESVELAETSLHETGKNPRKSPKWFKRAESSTRDLSAPAGCVPAIHGHVRIGPCSMP